MICTSLLLILRLGKTKVRTKITILLKTEDSPGDAVVPGPSAGVVVVGALRQESIDSVLVVKDDIEISLGRRGRAALARPLYPDGAEGLEGIDETLLRDVPGDSTQEDLAAVERVVMLPGR